MTSYRHNIAACAIATAHLSLTEHGAYRLLVDYAHASETKLPLDADRLYHICRAVTPVEKHAVATVISQFFKRTDRGYYLRKSA